MSLPEGFRFSQSSLQDYVDCPRRFQLRYLDGQLWPGVHVEPVLEHERLVTRGARFHRLVERHQLGMDVELLSETVADDSELAIWWRAYLNFEFLHGLEGARYPELSLFAVVAGVPLIAVFDLVVFVSDGRVIIFDWKTYSRVPLRQWFELRLQTRVYPYVLVLAGSRVLGHKVSADKVSFLYWVVSDPSSPVVFDYSPALYEQDSGYLGGLVSEILQREEWPLVFDSQLCRFCSYRSLCDRGSGAGGLVELSNMENNITGEELFFGSCGFDEVGF